MGSCDLCEYSARYRIDFLRADMVRAELIRETAGWLAVCGYNDVCHGDLPHLSRGVESLAWDGAAKSKMRSRMG